jgi:hypothetical protein
MDAESSTIRNVLDMLPPHFRGAAVDPQARASRSNARSMRIGKRESIPPTVMPVFLGSMLSPEPDASGKFHSPGFRRSTYVMRKVGLQFVQGVPARHLF